uniref:hypothetical protein n=1 Tax=Roseovarius sp. TaxID=1486281 RepID=UPI0035640A1D
GFPVEDAISRRSDWKEYIQLHVVTLRAPLADCLRQNADLRTPSPRARDNGLLNFVPMEREAAERFVSAAPERSVSLTLILRAEETSKLNHGSVVTFAIERAEVVAEATGETLLEIDGDTIEAANEDKDKLWAGISQLEGSDLFLESVRRDSDKLNDEDYVNRWIESAFCRDINPDNPIRLARLYQDHSDALATTIDEREPLGPKSIRMTSLTLGDYDLEEERFPLAGRSLDGERPLGNFSIHCRGIETRGANAPQSYEVTVKGLAEIAQTGWPLSLEDADAYIQSHGGRRNRWERINFFLIIDDVRFGAVDSSGVQQVEAEAVGYRIADRSGDEMLHEALLRNPSKTEQVEEKSPGPSNDPSTDQGQATGKEVGKTFKREAPLELLGLSIGMPREDARASLAGRFGDAALVRADDGTLIAESGPCRYAAAADPAVETEAGSNCVMVAFGPDDAVSNIVVRYVVSGSHVDAYAAQLEGSFGVPASRVHSEQVPDTLILGWGPELEATAAEVERDASAGQTLHALEARLTSANEITLVTARLDSEPADSDGDVAEAPPPIEF